MAKKQWTPDEIRNKSIEGWFRTHSRGELEEKCQEISEWPKQPPTLTASEIETVQAWPQSVTGPGSTLWNFYRELLLEWLKFSTKKYDKRLGYTRDEEGQKEKESFLDEILWEELNDNERERKKGVSKRERKKGVFTGMNPMEALVSVLDRDKGVRCLTNAIIQRVINEAEARSAKKRNEGESVPCHEVQLEDRRAVVERERAERKEFLFEVFSSLKEKAHPNKHKNDRRIIDFTCEYLAENDKAPSREEIATGLDIHARTVERFFEWARQNAETK